MDTARATITLCIAVGCTLAAAAGCAAPTTVVSFTDPAGARLTYRRNTYVFPVEVELRRPAGAGDVYASDIRLTLPTADGTLAAEGKLYVHGYFEQDVDRLSTNKCTIDDDNIESLQEGSSIIILGTSASNQLQYRMVLGPQK